PRCGVAGLCPVSGTGCVTPPEPETGSIFMAGRPIAWLLLAVCLLTGCGGGGGDTSGGAGNSPGSQPPSGIGSAGGTVNGPNGAKVVVPAGALSQNTNIAVAQSSTGAPALPAGLSAVGEMFALTP